jgi:hypothetical protein
MRRWFSARSRGLFRTKRAALPNTEVHAHNVATNLTVTAHSEGNGTFSVPNLPIGIYELSFSAAGFEKETHTQVLVQADRVTTVNGNLKVGATTAVIKVTGTPLMNQVDTTNGYVIYQRTIEMTPLKPAASRSLRSCLQASTRTS